MQWLSDFWAAYGSLAGLAMVNAVFALACYATLSTGVLSFAPVAFGAVGGILAAQLVLHTTIPLALIVLCGGMAGLGFAMLLAPALLRVEGHWTALATVALVLVTRVVVRNVPALTGGDNGLTVTRPLSMAVPVVTLLCVMLGFRALHHSWYGIASRVVRDDPAVAAGLGINIRQTRLIGFGVSGFAGGLAGVLLVLVQQFVSPDSFYVHVAFVMITGAVIGGSFHWLGPVLGAIAVTLLPALTETLVPDSQDIGSGIALLLALVFLPRDLFDPRVVLLQLSLAQATRTRDPRYERR